MNEALGGPVEHEDMDPAESLYASTVKAFCCMAGCGDGDNRRPMQVGVHTEGAGDDCLLFYSSVKYWSVLKGRLSKYRHKTRTRM